MLTNSVLTGEVPMDKTSPKMVNHSDMPNEMYCKNLITKLRAKYKLSLRNIFAKTTLQIHNYNNP